jgi:hypothetical protein
MVGTAIIALLAAVATAHTTSQPATGANYLLRIDMGKNNHPLMNPKSQLIHMISKNMVLQGLQTPATGRQSSIPSQIRPDVWAGSATVLAQTIF